MERLDLDYYYGKEAEQFTFYRLPKALITDDRFNEVTNSAKLLYGLMLDRMSLSRKRGWLDEENRVFIKYSVSNISDDLNVVKNTGIALLKELQDIGLIDVVQANGKANVIYVKNFIEMAVENIEEPDANRANKCTGAKIEPVDNIEQVQMSENREPVESTDRCKNWTGSEIAPVGQSDGFTDGRSASYRDFSDYDQDYASEEGILKNEPVQKLDRFNNCAGTGAEFEPVPVQNLDTNNKLSKNKFSETNSIHLSVLPSESGLTDAIDEAKAYMELIKENIDYDIVMSRENWFDRDLFEELYNIICDVVCVPRKTIRIGGENYPYQLVKSKFLKLKATHLEYVMSCMQRNTTKVNNIKAYLITALYNAPNTIDHYYTAEVNHDMYGVS